MVFAGLGALVLATFLQLAISANLLLGGLEPNLVLALVVAWAWVRGPGWAFAWALLGGLLLDVAGAGVVGVHAAALLLAAYAVGVVRSWRRDWGWPLLAPIGALGGLLYGALLIAALHVFGGELIDRTLISALLGGGVLSGGLLSLPFGLLFVALQRSLATR
ncbi:MAG: rod shape-determining protein MreD [Candidatus Dormiibacterota bacterium]